MTKGLFIFARQGIIEIKGHREEEARDVKHMA